MYLFSAALTAITNIIKVCLLRRRRRSSAAPGNVSLARRTMTVTTQANMEGRPSVAGHGAHITAMVRSHASGDEDAFYSVALQVAAREARQGHHRLAVVDTEEWPRRRWTARISRSAA